MVIRQYDIYRAHNDGASRYVFVLQHAINDSLPTVLVAPIGDVAALKLISKLDIPIEIEGRELQIRVHFMAAIPRSALRTRVENRSDLHDEVVAAIDILFTGF